MSDRNPCPFCGDESEYWRFLDLCAERANKIWRENEVEIFTTLYESLDFAQVVRCRDCVYICKREYANGYVCYTCSYFDSEYDEIELDGFCKWAVRKFEREDNDDEIY